MTNDKVALWLALIIQDSPQMKPSKPKSKVTDYIYYVAFKAILSASLEKDACKHYYIKTLKKYLIHGEQSAFTSFIN